MKISLPPKAKPAENPRQPGASGRGSAAGAGHRLARDSEATRSNILDIATQEFAEHGFSGARIDVISDKTRTSKRMLYYHFMDKKRLYKSVLKNYYIPIRKSELGE